MTIKIRRHPYNQLLLTGRGTAGRFCRSHLRVFTNRDVVGPGRLNVERVRALQRSYARSILGILRF